MRTNHLQRLIRVSLLSTFLALAACSFLAFGSASAHAATQTGSSTSGTIVRIVDNQQGAAVFSPHAITVTSGTPVKIVNRTPFTRFFHVTSNGRLFGLVSGASVTIIPTQSEQAILCSDGKSLTITVV